MSKESRTHILIYYVKEANNYIMTTPRLWAHGNPEHFPENENPRDVIIEDYLKSNFGFQEEKTGKTHVLYNFAIEISTGKNGKSFYKK